MNKYKFKNGAQVEGTVEQILEVAKSLGEIVDLSKLEGPKPKGFYVSESHGLIRIKDMNESHIRNALIKRSKEYYENLRKRKTSIDEFLKGYTSLAEDITVVELYNELAKR